jgi:uncharacterized protein
MPSSSPSLPPPPADTPRLARLRVLAEQATRERPPAHDALHVARVAAVAARLALAEGADLERTVAAALLHELVNLPKDHPESSRSGDLCAEAARALLGREGWPADEAEAIADCIRDHAFSKGAHPASLEGRVLQDADRLDAIGAIGLARMWATTTEMRRPFYDEVDPFCRGRAPDDKRFGLDHVFRKLLAIPERLHTAAARALAAPRVEAMKAHLAALERELAEAAPGRPTP